MKTNKIILFSLVLLSSTVILVSCSKDDDNPTPATVYYQQQDQMGRPGINTVFVTSADKDAFNITTPSDMNAAFQTKFQTQLLTGLNPGYTTNALTQTAAQLTTLLATDVLNVSLTAPTTFFDGTNVLTGRKLEDDVIDVELLLIFGGPTGTSNPTLTKDNVNANDKAFSASFPYLAAPF